MTTYQYHSILDGSPIDPPTFKEGVGDEPPVPFFSVEVTREMIAQFYVQATSDDEARSIAGELIDDIEWNEYDHDQNIYMGGKVSLVEEIPAGMDFWTWEGDDPSTGQWDSRPWR